MAPLLGILLHAIGGLAAGSFYAPFRKTRGWSWESCWLVMNVVAYLIMPCVAAWFVAPQFLATLCEAPTGKLTIVFVFGVLWGVGGLTFGLAVRYLGMSLGFAMALGLCAAFGTLIPPLAHGVFGEFIETRAGQTVLMGVFLCLAGIALCGYAGVRRESEVSSQQKHDAIRELSLGKGLVVAAIAGVMSSFMAFGIDAGKTIGQTAVRCGVADVYQNTPILVLVMGGNAVANVVWCLLLGASSASLGDYAAKPARQLLSNYFFAGMAGIIAYNEFFWYGLATTKMGRYDFSSWSIHLAFVIVFSSLWGLFFQEWRGIGRTTRRLLWGGLATLLLSTAVMGAGNCFSSQDTVEVELLLIGTNEHRSMAQNACRPGRCSVLESTDYHCIEELSYEHVFRKPSSSTSGSPAQRPR